MVLSGALHAAAAAQGVPVDILLDDKPQYSNSVGARVVNIVSAVCSGLAVLELLPPAEHVLLQDASSSSGTTAPWNVVPPNAAGGQTLNIPCCTVRSAAVPVTQTL